MSEIRPAQPNTALIRARRRRVLERKQASWLLGYKGPQLLAEYERGEKLPSLQNAIKLTLIYGCELEDIFPENYKLARKQTMEKATARTLIAHNGVQPLIKSINRCSYEDILVDEKKAELHRSDIRDHVTRLAKALAQI